jgi:hypothetical protein
MVTLVVIDIVVNASSGVCISGNTQNHLAQ